MKSVYTYYKNSNSGELFFTQEFFGNVKGIYFYNTKKMPIEQKSLVGCVTISEKKFKRESKKFQK